MQTFRTFHQLFIFSVLLTFAGTALAQSDPYSDWVFDLEKARKSKNAAAITKLASAQPELARIWFYGYVYDVVTTGVPAAEQAEIQVTSAQLAQGLSSLGQGHQAAQRLMERLGDDSIQSSIVALRLAEERWENTTSDVGMLPLQLSVVNHPEQAAQIFHRALFKASKWKTKLGGVDKAARFIGIARRLASGFALAYGEFDYWKALATYQGTPTVSLTRLSFVEETLDNALNQQISKSPKAAYTFFNSAYTTISKTRQDSLLVGLVMNGLAASAAVAGDQARALSLREQLYSGVRPLQLRALNEVIYGQLIGSYLQSSKLDQALRGVEQFVQLFNPEKVRVRSVALMSQAAAAFEAESVRSAKQSQLLRAIRFGEASITLFNTLLRPEYASVYYVNAEIDAARINGLTQVAEMYRRLASLHQLRADYTSVEAALVASQAVYRGELNRSSEALDLELLKATSKIEQGLFTEAEQTLDALRKSEGVSTLAVGTSHDLSAQQFLLRGAYAPAFAHANEGLKFLHENKVEAKSVYASLHSHAALALESAGFKNQALARWSWVDKFAPSFTSSVHQVRLLGMLGRIDEAVEMLEPYFETDDARATTVLQGCLLAGTDRHKEASASLTVLVPQLSLPSSRRFRAAGYACLAQIDAKTRNYAGAIKQITAARRALDSFPSAALRWKIDLLEARVLAASGKRSQSLAAYLKALSSLELNQYDSMASGSGLFDFAGGPILSLDTVHEEAASVALGLAQKSADSKRQSLLKTAVQRIRMHRAREMSAGKNPYQQVHSELAEITTLRVQRTKMLHLAGRLENVPLSQRRQAELNRAYKHAASQVDDLTRERIKRAKTLTNPYESRLGNRPSDRVSVYYLVEPSLSYAVVQSAAGYRLYTLPGSNRLAAINEQLDGLVQATPKDWSPTQKRSATDPNFTTWKRLRDHGRTLVPFMFGQAGKALMGKNVELFLDGDLIRTAFDALVITAPSKRQKSDQPEVPVYFSTAVNPIYLIGETIPAGMTQGQTALVYGGAPLKVCQSADTTDCVSIQTAAAVRQLIENTPASKKRAVSTLMDVDEKQAALVLGVPLNIVDGSVVVDASTVPLNETKGGVAEVVATILHWDIDMAKNEQGLTKMWGMLSRRGTQGLALYKGAFGDAEDTATTPVSEAISQDASTIAGLRAWMRSRAMSPVDIVKGGRAYHHPYYWTKWQLLGEAARWVAVAEVKPPKSATTQPTEGESAKAETPTTQDAAPAVKTPAVEDPFATPAPEAQSETTSDDSLGAPPEG